MSDAAALFAAILQSPDDDLLRLHWADVVERTDPERAEFVRVQIELARSEEWAAKQFLVLPESPRGLYIDALRRRERELLDIADHDSGWTGPAGWIAHEWQYVRGFVSRLRLSCADWSKHAAELLAAAPIRRVNRPKECGECRGDGYDRQRMNGNPEPWAKCPVCHGTGKVDDFRGDGVVRLTTWPAGGSGERMGEEFCLAWLANEHPGVWFELPRTDGNVFENVRFEAANRGPDFNVVAGPPYPRDWLARTGR